jgi:hypothetical protein
MKDLVVSSRIRLLWTLLEAHSSLHLTRDGQETQLVESQ